MFYDIVLKDLLEDSCIYAHELVNRTRAGRKNAHSPSNSVICSSWFFSWASICFRKLQRQVFGIAERNLIDCGNEPANLVRDLRLPADLYHLHRMIP